MGLFALIDGSHHSEEGGKGDVFHVGFHDGGGGVLHGAGQGPDVTVTLFSDGSEGVRVLCLKVSRY